MSSPRLSAEFHDHSTMVSRSGSVSNHHAPPRIDSLDDEEKAKKNISNSATVTTTPADIPDADPRSERTRRESALHDAWPAPELNDDPKLKQEVEQEEGDVFLVTFEENDPLNPQVCVSIFFWCHYGRMANRHLDPQNWSRPFRWYLYALH